ncbi:MAG TPA: ADOP family duplicated permease [Bryobacteraceae bacterium]|nr:ADOP family duplicated permease [Bryobacteraceae bacterium]
MRWPWQKEESDLEREIRYHLETLADGFEKQGMSRAEALKQARKEFGGVEGVREQCRDESRWSWLVHVGQDLRFGWRMMLKTPSVTLAAVGTLALGIGATTAILSLADAVLWRTLAVPAPEQLSEILWTAKERPREVVRSSSGSAFPENGLMVADFFSADGYRAMRDAGAPKAIVAAHIGGRQASFSYAGTVSVAHVRGVTGNFFPMLQVRPFVGRLLGDRDDEPGSGLVAVVTHRFWGKFLNADPAAVGTPITLNNLSYTIAGVLPPDFVGIALGDGADVYTTIQQNPEFLSPEGWYRQAQNEPLSWWMQVLARRNPGVSEQELAAVLAPSFSASWIASPKSEARTPHLRLNEASRGLGRLRRSWGDPVWMLLGLVAMVLLISCANIANLLLARAVEREKEAALRVSLGCGAGRLMRQFFTESLLLAAIGGLLSVAVALGLGQLMESLLPHGSDSMRLSLVLDVRSLLGAGGITLCTALLFGLYPAWRTARVNAAPALKEGSGSAGSMSKSRWAPAKLLVLVQVSLGVLLVTAAIVFTTRLNDIVSRDPGFERRHSLMFDVRPGEMGYKAERLKQFYVEVETRLASLAGVQAVGLSWTRPMLGAGFWDDVETPGNTKRVPSAIHHANAAFLDALGVPLVAGRPVTLQESRALVNVAIVDETIAQSLGNGSPLGMRVRVGDIDHEVVGVARKARYAEMVQSPAVVYIPFRYDRQAASVLVRTAMPPMAAFGAIRQAMKEIDKDMPLVDVFTMEQQISRTLQRERLFAWLCGSFGVLALVLCAVGIYGLMSHTTARRTGEIGIRMALGASRRVVLDQVLREGLALAVAGLVLGVPLALYAAKIATAQRLLPEGAMPYWPLGVALGLLSLSALFAVLAPALRASSVDPMQALRQG